MAEQKKIRCDDFTGGEGQTFLKDPKQYKLSNNIQIDLKTKKVGLSDDYLKRDFADLLCANDSLTYHESYFILAGLKATAPGNIIIQKTSGYNNFSTVGCALFAATATTLYKTLTFKNKYVIFYKDGATEKIASSTDNAQTFTSITSPMASNDVREYKITDNDEIYINCAGRYLYKTSDLVNFDLIYDGMTNQTVISNIELLDGFLYAEIHHMNSGNYKKFVRFENKNITVINTFNAAQGFSLIRFNNKIIIAITNDTITYFYQYDKQNTEFIFKTNKPLHGAILLAADDEKIYINSALNGSSDSAALLYTLDSNYALNHILTLAESEDITQLLPSDGKYWILSWDWDGTASHLRENYTANRLFQATGYIETSIINEGLITPRIFTINHDPLPANTTIKVYQKTNQAAAWSAAIITQATAGATRTRYSFPTGTTCDYMQFKIEFNTTDTTKRPTNMDYEFDYINLAFEG